MSVSLLVLVAAPAQKCNCKTGGMGTEAEHVAQRPSGLLLAGDGLFILAVQQGHQSVKPKYPDGPNDFVTVF